MTGLISALGRSETGAVCGGSSARKRSASRLPNRDSFTVLRRATAGLEGADDSSGAAVYEIDDTSVLLARGTIARLTQCERSARYADGTSPNWSSSACSTSDVHAC